MTDTKRWTSEALYAFFAEQGIAYERIDHPAVFTADEAERLVPKARGAVRKAHRSRGHGKIAWHRQASLRVG